MTFLCVEFGKNLDESNFYENVKNKCKDQLNRKLKCQACGKFSQKNGSLVILNKNNRANLILVCEKNQNSILLTLTKTKTVERFW